MNVIEIIIGIAAIIYAFVSVYFRLKSPAIFKKLEPMKRIYGSKLGLVLHVMFYTVIPFIFGILLIRAGLLGTTLF